VTQRRRTILLVDDDPDIRRMAALSLERIGGFEVSVVASGDEAIARATREPPDLLLLDVSMPGIDGPATFAALRRHAATERVPVVFFTATSSDDEVSRLLALGAIGVVSKPFDLMDLPVRIRGMLGRAGLD
jgi:two-component system OmpR family response regulator